MATIRVMAAVLCLPESVLEEGPVTRGRSPGATDGVCLGEQRLSDDGAVAGLLGGVDEGLDDGGREREVLAFDERIGERRARRSSSTSTLRGVPEGGRGVVLLLDAVLHRWGSRSAATA